MTVAAQAAVRLRVSDPGMSIVAAEQARLAARHAGLPAVHGESAATVAAELASNAQRYARDGQIVLQPATDACALDIVAFDSGPGTADLSRCFTDGYTTAGSYGSGLGAVARLATYVDAYSSPQRGTVVAARIGPASGAPAEPAPVAALGCPYPGEEVNGDAWSWTATYDGVVAVLADGLGHGGGAASASGAAVQELENGAAQDPAGLLQRISARLRGSRGAAVTVVRLRRRAEGDQLVVAGAGNVTAAVVHPDGRVQRTVIGHGTAGLPLSATPVTTTAVPPGAVVVLHTDGLSSSWTLTGSPEVLSRAPVIVAATLMRDHSRGTDDAGVVVIGSGERPVGHRVFPKGDLR